MKRDPQTRGGSPPARKTIGRHLVVEIFLLVYSDERVPVEALESV